MTETKNLPLTERYAFELGRKKALIDVGNMLSMKVTGKKIEHINGSDLARMITLRIALETLKQFINENTRELLEITKEAKELLEKNNVKENK